MFSRTHHNLRACVRERERSNEVWPSWTTAMNTLFINNTNSTNRNRVCVREYRFYSLVRWVCCYQEIRYRHSDQWFAVAAAAAAVSHYFRRYWYFEIIWWTFPIEILCILLCMSMSSLIHSSTRCTNLLKKSPILDLKIRYSKTFAARCPWGRFICRKSSTCTHTQIHTHSNHF